MQDIRAEIRRVPSPETLAWVADAVGSGAHVEGLMLLDGGSACAIHALDVADARGLRHGLVLKRFYRADWLEREPDVAEREARHLQWLAPVELPMPRLVAVDPRAEHCDLPAILMTRLPGRVELAAPDLDAWLRALVEPLLTLHAIPDALASRFGAYRSYNDVAALDVPAWSRCPEHWSRALERLRQPAPACAPRFVHRDYHPNNLLFLQGRLSAVLDFTDSSYGPAAVDPGHCRLNLAQLCGAGVAERFGALHEEMAPGSVELDPYWDLLSLIEILPGPDDVYWGWRRLGVSGLSTGVVRERLDDYVALLVAKLD